MRKILLLIVLLCFRFCLQGQHNDSIQANTDSLDGGSSIMQLISSSDYFTSAAPQIIPPSPQVQIFEKYINYPVAEYSGLPDISIPLYEIELKGLKIPIILSYHAGGIQYNQYDGDIAAGWSINAGGFLVSRTVYGRPDEKYDFHNPDETSNYLYMSTESINARLRRDAYLASLALGPGDSDLYIEAMNYKFKFKDSEYDHFLYNLPSSKEHFIITNRMNKQVGLAPNNLDKITLDEGRSDLLLENIKIIDKSGITYYLGGTQPDGVSLVEKRYPDEGGDITSGSWHLRQIVTPFDEVVSFKYKSVYERYSAPYGALSVTDAPYIFSKEAGFWTKASLDIDASASWLSTGASSYNTLFIEEIRTDKEIIQFERSGKKMTGIKIKTSDGITIKEVKFELYSYASNVWHSLLKSVLIGNNSLGQELYKFEYYLPLESNRDGLFPDQWNYYSGQKGGNSDLILHEQFKDDLVSYFNGPNTAVILKKTIAQKFPEYNNSNAWFNRSGNLGKHDYFSLKKMIFPTGGNISLNPTNIRHPPEII